MGGGGSGSTGGSAGSAGGSSSSSQKQIPNCKRAMVWNKIKRKCVAQQQGELDDNSIFETGRDLALAGRYDEAITILTLAADKTDARILNMLGYSHRREGRVNVGIGYYHEAILNDPSYTPVREYLGEALLQIGDLAAAKAQLAEIEKRCGTTCSDYTDLLAQIKAYQGGI